MPWRERGIVVVCAAGKSAHCSRSSTRIMPPPPSTGITIQKFPWEKPARQHALCRYLRCRYLWVRYRHVPQQIHLPRTRCGLFGILRFGKNNERVGLN
nr:hypothetical protein Iba_chr10fCG10940 [Ipomoea batatas]